MQSFLFQKLLNSTVLDRSRRQDILGPEIIQETTLKVKSIQEKMKAAQSRQKSYADKKQRPLEFNEGDHVILKVTPKMGSQGTFRIKKT
jgi:archaellin